jgi:hypothetical protein
MDTPLHPQRPIGPLRPLGPFGPLGSAIRLLCASVAFVVLAACGGDDDEGMPITVTLLHVNDHHSRLDEETVAPSLPDACGTVRPATVPTGGVARLAAAVGACSTRP